MIQLTTLHNGIRVITEKMPGVHSVSLGVWVASGSRHELPEQNGVTHFVEHMLFKGTERRTSHSIAREIDAVGGFLNAFTSREFCCFYAKVMGDKLQLALDLLSDIVLNSVFDKQEVEKERRVILQELHMVEDAPEDYIHDLYSQIFWKNHPLGEPTGGTSKSVSSLTREQLFDCLKERFVGRNLMVCAAGDIDHDYLVAGVDKTFSRLPAGERQQQSAPPDPQRRVNIEHRDLEQVHFCLGTNALPQNHPDRFTGYVLNSLLGGGMSSRLFQVIREEHGLAYSVYSYLNCHVDAGSLVIYSATAPEDSVAAIGLVLAEMRRLKREPVEVDLLNDTREQLKGNLLLSLESTDNRMSRLAKNQFYLDRQISVDEIVEQFDKVSVEDVQLLARRLFTNESLNLQFLGRLEASGFSMFDLTLES